MTNLKILSAAGLLLIAMTVESKAQVAVTGTTTYTQDFNSLPISGSATYSQFDSGTPTLPGWFAVRTGNGTTIVANDGGNNAGNLYSYGTGTGTDRALGSLGSGNAAAGHFAWGVVFQNTDAIPINASVTLTGEQWRQGTTGGLNHTVSFSYSITASAPTSLSLTPGATGTPPAGFTGVSALDFTSPTSGGLMTGSLDGNLGANQVQFNNISLGINLDPGQYLTMYWNDPDHAGGDHGMAIDNVSIGFSPVPEPATCLGLAAAVLAAARFVRRRRTRP